MTALTASERETLWIVEDSALDAMTIQRVLLPHYDIELFGDGPAMIERLVNGARPVVLILDWYLPGMSGLEVCRFVRSLKDEIELPILMLTVHGHPPDIVEGLSAGANDYVTKPYGQSELLARIRSLARVRRLFERAQQAEAETRRYERLEADARADAETRRAQLYSLFMQAPTAICVLRGPTHVYELANPGWEQLVGRRDLVGQPAGKVGPALGESSFLEILDRSFATGHIHLDAERCIAIERRGDGLRDTAYFNVLYQPYRGPAGSIAGIMIVAVEVTEQVLARHSVEGLARRLGQQQEWLEAILDLTPVPLILLEPTTGRVTFANRATEKLWGGPFPRPAALAEHAAAFGMRDERGQALAPDELPTARAARGELLQGEVVIAATARGEQSLLVHSASVPGMTGYPSMVVVSLQDVTHLKETERALEDANRSKDEFFATMSHELRTPLTAIVGWAHMLRSGGLPPDKVKRAVETIDRNAKAQAQLIDDLLDMSRIISGKLRLDMERVDLDAVVALSMDSVRPAAEAKGIVLAQHLDPELPAVRGDAGRLQQVVWNLLANAVKFTPRGGRVDVTLAREGADARLTVADTGQGIHPDFLPNVFERFRQAETGFTRGRGGLGLGLAIVRSLVELHGGRVSASSAGEGQGAEFVVRLPLAPALPKPALPELPALTPAAAAVVPDLRGMKVLLVDDDDDVRELFEVILSRCGAETLSAPSAARGMELLCRERPDVLVSDVGMPVEDGLTLIRRVRALDGEVGAIPTVALTAYARGEDRQRALAAGFDAYVAKPVDLDELLVVLATFGRRLSRQRR